MSVNFIPRVTQLDALQLDKQLEDLFKELLLQATKFLESRYLQLIIPELELIIRTWMFKYSVCNNYSTFGQQMLSLKYKSDNFSNSKLYWYYAYTIGLKYLKDKALYSYTSNEKIQNIVYKLETFQLIADIFNFLRFIKTGKYPLLIDFILGLNLTADRVTREDLADFSWTRELLWHNFIELIGTGISLINIFGLNTKMTNMLKYGWWRKQVRPSAVPGTPVMNVHTLCAYCSNVPILPQSIGCSHLFCYYCATVIKTADQDFTCPKCYYNGKQITKFIVS